MCAYVAMGRRIRGSYPDRDTRFGGQSWLQLTCCLEVSLGIEEGVENVRMVELRTEIRAGDRVNTKQKFWSQCSGVDS